MSELKLRPPKEEEGFIAQKSCDAKPYLEAPSCSGWAE